jgi:zinc-binding alcohol dehydrogenase/oxidoreductase
MQGLYPGLQLPVTLGSDGAGIVESVGVDADPSLVGEEVLMNPGLHWGESPAAQGDRFEILGMPTDGTFATHVVVPASCLHPRPTHLSWEEAAALPLAGVTAYRALFTRGQVESGQNVLITGIGGGVATFALQFAVAAGANVFVTSSSAEKISAAKSQGALEGFFYTDDEWYKTCGQETGGMDVIIDSAAGPNYGRLLDVARPAARIVNYGATAGPPEKIDMFKVFWKQLSLCGSTMGSPAEFAKMLEFVSQHTIRPVVDKTYPLPEGNEALARMNRGDQRGKIVLVVG